MIREGMGAMLPDMEATMWVPLGKVTRIGLMFLCVIKESRWNVIWSVAIVSRI